MAGASGSGPNRLDPFVPLKNSSSMKPQAFKPNPARARAAAVYDSSSSRSTMLPSNAGDQEGDDPPSAFVAIVKPLDRGGSEEPDADDKDRRSGDVGKCGQLAQPSPYRRY